MGNTLHPVYQLLLEHCDAAGDQPIEEILIGLTWTYCRLGNSPAVGLAMSPPLQNRTLQWPGTLVGRPARKVSQWVEEWNSWQATIGMATINALLPPSTDLLAECDQLNAGGPANLAVFEYFKPRLFGSRVVVIGRYPHLDGVLQGVDYQVIERLAADGDLPDPAAEYLLPQADWVFLTATSLINKTFPRLAELAANSQLVLMGPTTPWVTELAQFGVNYLSGVIVNQAQQLRQTVAEGGGTRIFDSAVSYAVLPLG